MLVSGEDATKILDAGCTKAMCSSIVYLKMKASLPRSSVKALPDSSALNFVCQWTTSSGEREMQGLVPFEATSVHRLLDLMSLSQLFGRFCPRLVQKLWTGNVLPRLEGTGHPASSKPSRWMEGFRCCWSIMVWRWVFPSTSTMLAMSRSLRRSFRTLGLALSSINSLESPRAAWLPHSRRSPTSLLTSSRASCFPVLSGPTGQQVCTWPCHQSRQSRQKLDLHGREGHQNKGFARQGHGVDLWIVCLLDEHAGPVSLGQPT